MNLIKRFYEETEVPNNSKLLTTRFTDGQMEFYYEVPVESKDEVNCLSLCRSIRNHMIETKRFMPFETKTRDMHEDIIDILGDVIKVLSNET